MFYYRGAPVTDFSGYPANLKAGYRIFGAGRIPDIRQNLNIQLGSKIWN
jgi:hypothetical protein